MDWNDWRCEVGDIGFVVFSVGGRAVEWSGVQWCGVGVVGVRCLNEV